MDICVVATTNSVPTNEKDWWKRKLMTNARVHIGNGQFEELDKHAQVAHVRDFTRLSARRLCWGHAAPQEEVEATTSDELMAIMPEAGILGPDNEYLAPTIWALMNGTEQLEQPALLDCDHKWWSNPNTYRWGEADNAAQMCRDYQESIRSIVRGSSWAYGQGRAHIAAQATVPTASTTAANALPCGVEHAHRPQI